ncbi:MAG: hypothetical protein E7284_02555 [Lachnospiraceae bacterium]|nr:hypothetical protein [Lachnospiraceae bacterium]
MDTSLAINGLPELTLTGTATTGTVGGNATTVSAACENLDTYATSMDAFIEELEAQKDEILLGWEGEAADALRESFPGLIEAFREVPPSIRSISNWATTTMNAYVRRDQSTAESIRAILGGK